MNTLLSHPAAAAFGWAIVHSLWQFTLIVGIFQLLSRRINTAHNRHYLYLSALGTLPLILVATFLYYYQPVLAATEQMGETIVIQLDTALNATTENSLMHSSTSYLPYLSLLYLLGLLAMATRSTLDYFGGRYLRRSSTAPPTELNKHYRRLLANYAPDLQVAWRVSARVTTAMTVGLFRPVILFPVGLINQLSLEETEAILLHEIAHLLRKDHLWNALQVVIQTLLFYHPIVHWLGRRLDREREFACDDFVSNRSPREVYAQSLLTVAKFSITHKNQFIMQAQGKSSLTRRIQRLFQPETTGTRNRLPLFLSLLMLPLLWSSSQMLIAQINPADAPAKTTEPILVNGDEDKTAVHKAFASLDSELDGLDGLDALDLLDTKAANITVNGVRLQSDNALGEQQGPSVPSDSIPKKRAPRPDLRSLLGPGFDYDNTAVFINGKRYTGNEVYDLRKLEIGEINVLRDENEIVKRGLKGYLTVLDITTNDAPSTVEEKPVVVEGQRVVTGYPTQEGATEGDLPVVKGYVIKAETGEGDLPVVTGYRLDEKKITKEPEKAYEEREVQPKYTIIDLHNVPQEENEEIIEQPIEGQGTLYLIDDQPVDKVDTENLDPEVIESVNVIKGEVKIENQAVNGSYKAAVIIETKEYAEKKAGSDAPGKTKATFKANEIRINNTEDPNKFEIIEVVPEEEKEVIYETIEKGDDPNSPVKIRVREVKEVEKPHVNGFTIRDLGESETGPRELKLTGDQDNEDILWIIDEKIVDQPATKQLKPEKIESISVYKGQKEVDALGYNTGHQSAIVITTKK